VQCLLYHTHVQCLLYHTHVQCLPSVCQLCRLSNTYYLEIGFCFNSVWLQIHLVYLFTISTMVWGVGRSERGNVAALPYKGVLAVTCRAFFGRHTLNSILWGSNMGLWERVLDFELKSWICPYLCDVDKPLPPHPWSTLFVGLWWPAFLGPFFKTCFQENSLFLHFLPLPFPSLPSSLCFCPFSLLFFSLPLCYFFLLFLIWVSMPCS
jgi:hypothetical protein